MSALTKEQERHRKMLALHHRTHGPAPDRYRAIARWWRLHAQESRNADGCMRYADNQDRLYADMLARPRHYRVKPSDLSDYQWSQR